jgi:hypothetical protein
VTLVPGFPIGEVPCLLPLIEAAVDGSKDERISSRSSMGHLQANKNCWLQRRRGLSIAILIF